MRESRLLTGISVMALFGTLTLGFLASQRFPEPFPPLAVSLSSPVARLSDFLGIALGFRRLTADLAWIQTLVYYGTYEEEGDPDEVSHSGGGHYPLFLAYCQRVAQIEPNFKYVYYYGSGVLGWNLNRLEEAEALLKEGIQKHPKEWRFQQFLAALAFQKNHNIDKLAEFLEAYAEEADCPNILRSILANIYKRQKRYDQAIRIWLIVFNTGDHAYMERATSQIQELAPLAHSMHPKMGTRTH